VSWWVIGALALGTYVLRLAGPLLCEKVVVGAATVRLLTLAAAALLVALAATSAVLQDGGFAGWARAAGVGVGAAAVWRRAPFVVVVAAAAATTAGLRAVGVG